MASHRALAVVTALLMIAGSQPTSAQQLPVQLLFEIERLLIDSDYQQLMKLLEENPQLYANNTPLAVELRNLLSLVEEDPFAGYAFDEEQTEVASLDNIY